MNLYRTFREFLEKRGCEKAFNQAFALQNPGYVLDAALWEILGGDEFFLGRRSIWHGGRYANRPRFIPQNAEYTILCCIFIG